MTGEPVKADSIRASDAERDQVITQLREHAAEGRLDTDKLSARIDAAFAATTRGELVAVTHDLPEPPPPRPDERRGFYEHLRVYVAVITLLVVIWALTGAGYFWPIWPALGWGIGIASHGLSVRGHRTG